jgi:lipopolysaccharide transport system ATP-binding protein
MGDIALRVESVGKRYRIGVEQGGNIGVHRYKSLRDSLGSMARRPMRSLRSALVHDPMDESNSFWALQGINFEVKHGEVVGIIGRNGAGKSTLLKILSRITKPTAGRVSLYGRVGSLLEVGTGFHPELTGRENIYLNGAILGMTHVEVKAKFDEIVAFSEVERFLDTAVKHYSSGMYMRLAFAVAAHLDPEILVVDEVLSVGDANFQAKCLGKMQQVGAEGRTVLFVSHNMPAMMRLCVRMVLLEKGRVAAEGDPLAVSRQYLHGGEHGAARKVWSSIDTAPGDEVARLKEVTVLNAMEEPSDSLDIRQPIRIAVEYWNLVGGPLKPTVCIHVVNEDGILLLCSGDFSNGQWSNADRAKGVVRSVCEIPGNYLAEGRFFILAAVCTYNPDIVHAIEPDAVSFQVVDKSAGDGARGLYAGKWPGIIRPLLNWQVSGDNG